MKHLLAIASLLLAMNSQAQQMQSPMPGYVVPPTPVYLPVSQRLNEEGLVMVRVLINVGGEVEGVGIHKSSGFPRLDDSALAAVAKAKFQPFRSGSAAPRATFLVPVQFQLDPPLPPAGESQ